MRMAAGAGPDPPDRPNLVLVSESPENAAEMRAMIADIDRVIRTEPAIGAYDQTI